MGLKYAHKYVYTYNALLYIMSLIIEFFAGRLFLVRFCLWHHILMWTELPTLYQTDSSTIQLLQSPMLTQQYQI